jgi:hypothetical protein
MFWGVAVFQTACFVGFPALVGAYAWQSVRRRRVQAGLWLALGILSMSWLESPYDNTMYAVFHPDFARLPAWGPIGLTQGGLPVIAPPGYVVYFLLPAVIAVPIARWAMRRFGWSEPTALLGVGLAVGMAFDGVIETGQASTLHLWTFARTAPGLTQFPGTVAQVPVTVYLAMGLFMMAVTYLLGRRVGDDEPVLESWVAARTAPGNGRLIATAAAYIGIAHLVYVATMVPHAITKLAGMLTLAGPLQPYPEIAPQPAGPQANGLLGTAILVVWLLGLTVAAFVLVRRSDPGTEPAAPAGSDPMVTSGSRGELV